MEITEKRFKDIYGQLTSGMNVSISLGDSIEADKIITILKRNYNINVKRTPTFIWVNDEEAHQGFIFSIVGEAN